MNHRERVQVFIDEANLMGAARLTGRFLDWLELRDFFLGKFSELSEILVYIGLPPHTPEWSDIRHKKENFVRWLKHNGFLPVTKDGSSIDGRICKTNVDTIMAADLVEWAMQSRPDVVVMVTGDGDFAYVANKLRRLGIRVEVAAIESMLSNELRNAANQVIFLDSFLNTLAPVYHEAVNR